MKEDGYYWANPIESDERQIIEVIDGYVYVMGDDRTYKEEEFTNWVKVPNEHPR